jgi:RND family efflux transporter MFP subunit
MTLFSAKHQIQGCVTVFIVLTVCMCIAGCGKEPVEEEIIRPVIAIQVGDPESLSGRTYPGRAAASEEVDLGFELAGTLIARPVNKGDEVKEGQLLAKLDPSDFINDLKAAKAERDRARAYYDRIRIAVKSGAVSKQDLTDAQARLDVANAKVKIKQKQLDDSEIRAPFDGIIGATYVENYQRVRPKEIVLRLLDISSIKFTVNVPETLISYVPYVTRLWLEFDAFPGKKISARIKEIGAEASLTTRTYPVTVIMDQPADLKILPGMAGNVTGEAELPESLDFRGIPIPAGAIFTPDDQKEDHVWIFDPATKTVHPRVVKTDRVNTNGIMVLEGIKPGDWIVTAGLHSLHEGQKVSLFDNAGKETAQ